MAAVALAAPGSSRAKPLISISAPGEVVGGTEFFVTGKVSDLATPGPIVVQVNRGSGWKTLARGLARTRGFKVGCVLEGEGGVRLRVTLGPAGHPTAGSAPRRLLVRPLAAAASTPGADPSASASPTTATVEPPPPTSPEPTPPSPPESTPPSGSEPTPPPPDSTYWGAWIGPQFTGTPAPEDMNAVTDFEALSGKPLSLLETYAPWAVCSGATCAPNQPFPAASFEKMRNYGAVPLYSWASERNGEVNEPDYQLADIIAGTYDSYIRQWALEAKAWGASLFPPVRLGDERQLVPLGGERQRQQTG